MTTARQGEAGGTLRRPVGLIQPPDAAGRRARAALAERRLEDALANIRAMPESDVVSSVWRWALEGELHFLRDELPRAESSLLRAAAAALAQVHLSGSAAPPDGATDGTPPSESSSAELERLAAAALDMAGCIRRRLDRPGEALVLHEFAYQLRLRAGSAEELTQSASHVALDADLQKRAVADMPTPAGVGMAPKRADDAERWHRRAIEHAGGAVEDGDRWRATAWDRWAASLLAAGRFEDARQAAERAREFAHAHAAGSLEAFRADMRYGHAVLKCAERLIEQGGAGADDWLVRADGVLASAVAELKSFGDPAASDVRWCVEQLDFLHRLRQSATVSPVT